MHISILLFDGVDLLDSGGPYEVFLTANRLAERAGNTAPFTIDTVTPDRNAVTAYGGLGLVPSAAADVLATTDLLVVPGTVDLSGPLADTALIDAISEVARRADVTLSSVCTGAFLLERAGALGAKTWTTHWEDIDLLAEHAGLDGARRGVRWVDAGTVVTGGALSSGLAMALHLVERFASRQLAEATANQIDYVWTETSTGTAAPRTRGGI
jgi:transcriptional regulator GlxA family with amidase domain